MLAQTLSLKQSIKLNSISLRLLYKQLGEELEQSKQLETGRWDQGDRSKYCKQQQAYPDQEGKILLHIGRKKVVKQQDIQKSILKLKVIPQTSPSRCLD